MQLNGLDWVLLGTGLFCLGRGFLRGAISQVFGIAGVLGGFILASHFYEPLGYQLTQSFPQLSGAHVIAFILLFFLTWFCLGFVGFGISRVLQRTGLGFFDRIWGGVVGLAKALTLGAILIAILTFFLSSQNTLLRKSALTPYIQEAARVLVQTTPERVQTLFQKKQGEIKRYWLDRSRDGDKPKLFREKEARVVQ